MFHNTINGDYEDKGLLTSYIFPQEAVLKISDVSIPIGELMVKCYGGGFDGASIEHFTRMASLLHPRGYCAIQNTAIFIRDNTIAENGYPNRKAFEKKGYDYLNLEGFISYRETVLREKQNREPLTRLASFIAQWVNDNRENKLNEINEIIKIKKMVKGKEVFPVNLSIIYDDRLLHHTSHIILSFQADRRCILHIENTLPILEMLHHCTAEDKYIMENAEKLYEKVREDESSYLDLYTHEGDKKKLVKTIELAMPVNQWVVREAYSRMIKVLQDLGLIISQVKVHHSHNQKRTRECVVYAIQNKLDTFPHDEDYTKETNEMPRQRGIRLRAEQAVLSYLLTGMNFIPRFNDQEARDNELKYDEATWYPDFPDVCRKLDEVIKNLSFQELNRLYLSMELDEAALHYARFADFIFSAMKEKMPHDQYKQIACDDLDENRAKFLEKSSVPNIFYNSKNKSLFMSNVLFSVKQAMEKGEVEIGKDIDKDNKRMMNILFK